VLGGAGAGVEVFPGGAAAEHPVEGLGVGVGVAAIGGPEPLHHLVGVEQDPQLDLALAGDVVEGLVAGEGLDGRPVELGRVGVEQREHGPVEGDVAGGE
jgi:hypothetical protein